MKMNYREGDYGQISKNGRTDRRSIRNSGKTCLVNLVMQFLQQSLRIVLTFKSYLLSVYNE